MAPCLLNVFIYNHSQAHSLRLKKIILDYTKDNHIDVGDWIYTTRLDIILNRSHAKSGFYLLNIDDWEEQADGIEFARKVRENDLYSSIVFFTAHDLFESGRSDLALRSFKDHTAVMSFLSKDSVTYEKEIEECIAIHMRKIFNP